MTTEYELMKQEGKCGNCAWYIANWFCKQEIYKKPCKFRRKGLFDKLADLITRADLR